MYPAPFRYHRPDSLDAAIKLLERLGDDLAAVLSGDHTRLKPQRWEGPPALVP